MSNARQVLKSKMVEQNMRYFGNEASDIDFYVETMMLLKFGDFEKRKKIRDAKTVQQLGFLLNFHLGSFSLSSPMMIIDSLRDFLSNLEN